MLFYVDDDRVKTYLKQVTDKNRTYDVPEESVALTHITSDLCRTECGIYDEDFVGNVCLHC